MAEARSAASVRVRAASFASSVLRAAGSAWALALVVGGFVISGWWIALTARPFMLFDEIWHVNQVIVYSSTWLPVVQVGETPASLGSVARGGSFLYHFAMSFPWRVAVEVTGSETVALFVVRCTSVLVHAGALVAAWMLGRTLRVPMPAVLLAVLAYAALPVTSFLAATVNYDSAQIALLVWLLVLVAPVVRGESIGIARVLGILVVANASILVKFTSAPFVVAVLGLVVSAVVVRAVRRRRVPALHRPHRAAGWLGMGALLVLGAALVAMSVERYVMNLVVYGAPVPDCAVVEGVERCMAYGPWARNAALDAANADVQPSIAGAMNFFVHDWWPRVVREFTVVGYSGSPPARHTSMMLVAPMLAIAVPFLAIVLLPLLRRRLDAALCVAAVGTFALSILAYNYLEYARFGELVAVQGRYLLPVGLVVLVVAAGGVAEVWRRSWRGTRPIATVVLVAVCGAMLVQGGGASTYVVGARPDWLAEESPLRDAIPTVRAVVSAVTLEIPPPS